MDDRRNYNRRKLGAVRIRKTLVVIILLFLLAGIAAAAVFLLRGCRTASVKRTLPFRADSNWCYTGNGFLYTGDRVLNFMSLEDEDKNSSVPINSGDVSVAGTTKLNAVYGASSLQVVGTPTESAFDGVIKKLACGGRFVGVYVENTDGSSMLSVYNSAGERCYYKDLAGTVLLDFGFEGGESSTFWMSELVTTGSSVSTTVTTYDLNRESITGVISIQGQIAKRIFMTKKSVFVYCTDSMIRFDRSTNEEAYRLQCRGYECVGNSAANGRMYLLLEREGTEKSPLSLVSLSESGTAEEKVISVTGVPGSLACFVMGGKPVIAREDGIRVLKDNGETELAIGFESALTSAEKLDENNILAVCGNELILVTLK